MIETSQSYNEKIKDLFNRKIYGKVQIDYTDPEIDQSISVDFQDNNIVSFPMQIVNGKNTPNYDYITLDGTWKLGDDVGLAPSEFEKDSVQFGLWGEELSNSNGTFTTNPIIILEFVPRPFTNLKLVGDIKKNEFPVEFEFRLYNEYDELITTEHIIDNDSVNWNEDIQQVSEIVKIEIEIIKWNKPNRVIKIMEVFSSIQETYYGEDIISIKLLEEKEVAQGSLPIGNISSNELSINLNNINREFDAGNVNSKLYGLVKPNRKITAWIGTENELIKLGKFWSKDWDVEEDGIVAKTTGRDRLDRLGMSVYRNSIVEINKSVYYLVEEILKDANLKSNEYKIDIGLKDYIIPYFYMKPISHREALRQVVTAGIGQVYCDRDSVIVVDGFDKTFDKLETPIKAFLQTEFPAEIDIIDAYGISGDDYFSKNNPSRRSDIANHITVETQPLIIGDTKEIYSTNEYIDIVANEDTKITINFNTVPSINVNLELEGIGQIIDSEIFSWGADVVVRSNTNGQFKIKATGEPLEINNKNTIIKSDDKSVLENGIVRYKFPDNHLVQTNQTASIICDKLLTYYKDPRRDLEMEWRGNPALELGDIVIVNDYPRDEDGEQGYYYITKQELTFAGYLRAKLEGRRV